jgi:hypothetical protein
VSASACATFINLMSGSCSNGCTSEDSGGSTSTSASTSPILSAFTAAGPARCANVVFSAVRPLVAIRSWISRVLKLAPIRLLWSCGNRSIGSEPR